MYHQDEDEYITTLQPVAYHLSAYVAVMYFSCKHEHRDDDLHPVPDLLHIWLRSCSVVFLKARTQRHQVPACDRSPVLTLGCDVLLL